MRHAPTKSCAHARRASAVVGIRIPVERGFVRNGAGRGHGPCVWLRTVHQQAADGRGLLGSLGASPEREGEMLDCQGAASDDIPSLCNRCNRSSGLTKGRVSFLPSDPLETIQINTNLEVRTLQRIVACILLKPIVIWEMSEQGI